MQSTPMAILPGPTYTAPRTLADALAAAGTSDGASFIAGGTDLMIRRVQGHNDASTLVDLTRISELRGIVERAETVAIGAAVTLVELERSPLLAREWPALVLAARSIASPVIRASATVVGNLLCENRCIYFDQTEFWREAVGSCLKCGGDMCIATGGSRNCYSVFISDLAPVLICLDARIEFVGPRGPGSIAVEALYSGDGIRPHTIEQGTILTNVILPRGVPGRVFFRKNRPRSSVDFTSLTVAMRVDGERLVIAASGVAARPAVVRLTPDISAEAAAAGLLAHTQIIENHQSGRLYRRDIVRRTLRDGMIHLGLHSDELESGEPSVA